jgi:hypothetical protein
LTLAIEASRRSGFREWYAPIAAQIFPVRTYSRRSSQAAAREHDLPLAALVGILAVEDGKTGEALRNTNGTWDVGRFQINTCHVNSLTAMGITAEAVLRDGCVNARAAAWLLRREYVRTGNIWAAIGAYHSRTPKRRDAYIAKVRKHLSRLGFKGLAALSVEEVRR